MYSLPVTNKEGAALGSARSGLFWWVFFFPSLQIDLESKKERGSSVRSTYLRIHWLMLVCALTRDHALTRGRTLSFAYRDDALTSRDTQPGMVVVSCGENPVCKIGENLFRPQWVVGRKGGVSSRCIKQQAA